MRRLFVWSIIILLLLSLCGCKNNETFTIDTDTSIKYDPDNVIITPNPNPVPTGTSQSTPEPYAQYSDIMKQIGKNGVIAAGYATGLRESFWNGTLCYTLTEFVVTDTYKGRISSPSITIKEPFALIEENGEKYYLYSGKNEDQLKNNLQVLVFLKPLNDGTFKIIYHYIPLMPDYNEYDDVYLQSVLDFFRGDKEEYIAEGPWKEAVTTPSGKTVHNVYHLAFWEEREISDEDLLAEMNNHLLLRTATEYKIAIWPYGHKNFTQSQYADRQFKRICIPMQEYFK